MKMTHILRYVDDVDAALSFYERAFGFERKFLHEGGDYGELETGSCALSFADNALIESHGLGFRDRARSDDVLARFFRVISQRRFVGPGGDAVAGPHVLQRETNDECQHGDRHQESE